VEYHQDGEDDGELEDVLEREGSGWLERELCRGHGWGVFARVSRVFRVRGKVEIIVTNRLSYATSVYLPSTQIGSEQDQALRVPRWIRRDVWGREV
jgi:hypothetical protein